MIKTENPYKGASIPIEANYQDPIVHYTDRAASFAQSFLSRDLEKQIDRVGKIAYILDWGVYGVVAGIQGAILLNRTLLLNLQAIPGFFFIYTVFKVMTLPFNIFFIGMGLIEGFVEFLNLRRASLLLYKVQKKKAPLEKIEWLKQKYFTLKNKEQKTIHRYIEAKYSHLSRPEKAENYDRVAEKSLNLKFAALERRITPGLAKEVKNQLETITVGLRSGEQKERNTAIQKAEILMQSVSAQAQNKIIVHMLGMVGIGLTLIGLTAFLVGVTSGAFFLALGIIATITMLLSLVLRKGLLSTQGARLYNKISHLMPTGVPLTPLLKTQEVPAQ